MMTEWRTLLQKVGGGKKTKMITLPSALTQFISLFSLGPLALFTLLFRLSAATAVMALNSDSEHTYKTTTDKQFGKKRELSLSSFFILSICTASSFSVRFVRFETCRRDFVFGRAGKERKEKKNNPNGCYSAGIATHTCTRCRPSFHSILSVCCVIVDDDCLLQLHMPVEYKSDTRFSDFLNEKWNKVFWERLRKSEMYFILDVINSILRWEYMCGADGEADWARR